MVWGGLHTVVPVALVLSLPQGFPFREKLQVIAIGFVGDEASRLVGLNHPALDRRALDFLDFQTNPRGVEVLYRRGFSQ